VGAIVLAAGAGTRMGGQPKALLALHGQSFLARVVATARAAGVERIVVVTGHAAQAVSAAAEAQPDLLVVHNPEPARGQLSSLKVGLHELGDLDGALAWPVDHPLVRADTVREIVDAASRHPGRAVIPRFEGRGGHPTFFPRTLVPALLALPDQDGARALYQRHPEAVVRLDVDDPGVRHDIDTPADYARVPEK